MSDDHAPLTDEELAELTWERPRDGHGRAFYAPNEVPPASEHFAHWRGRLTHPSASTGNSPSTHKKLCVAGWIPSGEWWLHCGVCRPEAVASDG